MTISFLLKTNLFAVVLMGLMCSVSPSLATQDPAPLDGWELIKDKNGVQSYKMHTKGSSVLAFRAQTTLDAPPEKIITVMMDAKRFKQWVPALKSSKFVTKPSPLEHIVYTLHSGAYFFFITLYKPRDFVYKITVEPDARAQRVLLTYSSIEHPKAPKEEKHIRAELLHSVIYLVPKRGGTKTFIDMEMHVDPKGKLPGWVINWVYKWWARTTVKKLQKHLVKRKIEIDPSYKALFDMGSVQDAK